MSNRSRWTEDSTDLDRLVFFSDGVFAIAITLTAVRITVPSSDVNLTHQLAERIPEIVTFAFSFMVIGFMWLAHHRMFHFVERGDGRLAALTLLLLLLVAFAPFPVALVGAHGDHVAPVVIYAITLGASNLVLGATWLYATWKRRLVPADLETSFIRYVSIRTFAVPIVFAISIPLAFLPHGPAIAEWSWAAVFPARRIADLIAG